MAVATSETFSYGTAVDPRSLQIGQSVIAVQVFFKPEVPSSGPSMGQRESTGIVVAVPAMDSEGGFVHIRPNIAEPGQGSPPIQVIGIARGAAMLDRAQVESVTYFYTPGSITD